MSVVVSAQRQNGMGQSDEICEQNEQKVTTINKENSCKIYISHTTMKA